VASLRAAGCVFAEDEATLLVAAARTSEELAAMVRRRVSGLPLEQVVGWAELCGHRIAVEPGVFAPRRRTELLARQATSRARSVLSDHPPVVVDLCCGSGAVGAVLLAEVRDVELHAVDVDPAAVRCARRNIRGRGGRAYRGDLYQPLPESLRGRVDLVVAVTPYVPTVDLPLMPREARLHEPPAALDGGADGLDVLRRVSRDAYGWLVPGGWLLTETSERQADHAAEILAGDGLLPEVTRSEEATVVSGAAPG